MEDGAVNSQGQVQVKARRQESIFRAHQVVGGSEEDEAPGRGKEKGTTARGGFSIRTEPLGVLSRVLNLCKEHIWTTQRSPCRTLLANAAAVGQGVDERWKGACLDYGVPCLLPACNACRATPRVFGW